MREALPGLGAKPDHLQQLSHPCPRRVMAVDRQRLADNGRDFVARIEGTERILEDDLHVAPAPAHLAVRQGKDVFALEDDGAAGGFNQPQQGARQRGFAAAGLADDAQHLAALERKAHAIQSAHNSAMLAGIVLRKLADLEQRAHEAGFQHATR